MKRLMGLVFGICLWVSIVLGVIHFSSQDTSFYQDRYQELNTAQTIGVSSDDLSHVTNVLVDYLMGRSDSLAVDVTLNGQIQPFFNQREIDHMVDVQALFVKTIFIRNLALGGLILSLLAAIGLARKSFVSVLTQGMIEASMVLGTLFAFLMVYAVLDFEGFWIQFHQTLFTNDLWLLNPNTDNLINLVPEPFFTALVGLILYRIVLLLGLISFGLYAAVKRGLNSRALKWFALIVMVIDHVGHFLFPAYLELRFVGRLAFPIFTFLFAQSYRFTHSKRQLFIRVAIAAVLGQGLIQWAGATELVSIFFLFLLGMMAFEAIDRKLAWAIIPIALTAQVFKVDYGVYGILVLANFYAFNGQFRKQAIGYALITLVDALSPFFNPNLWPMIPTIIAGFTQTYYRYFIQVFSVVTLIPLAFYRNEKPKAYPEPFRQIETYFFYVFYPLHIALLALMRKGSL